MSKTLPAKIQTEKLKKPKGRLDSKAWISAALDALAKQGIEGVKIEAIARQLGVTKGSFYWHFKDREDLHDAMLKVWRMRSTVALIERVDQSGSNASERLTGLIRLMFGPGSERGDQLELSIRLWGRRYARAAEALREVDELRTRHIARLLADAGIPDREAEARAIIVYAYMRVAPSLRPIADQETMALAESIILGQK